MGKQSSCNISSQDLNVAQENAQRGDRAIKRETTCKQSLIECSPTLRESDRRDSGRVRTMLFGTKFAESR